MIVPTILYISLIVSAIMIIIGFLNLKNVYNIYMLMSGGLLLLLIGIFVLVNGGVTAQTGLVETTNFTYEEVLFPNFFANYYNITTTNSLFYFKNETYNQTTIDSLITNSSGVWEQSGTDIYYDNGNVGIGTNNPQFALDLDGSLNLPSSEAIRFDGEEVIRFSEGTNNDLANVIIGLQAGNTSSFRQTVVGYRAGFDNTGPSQSAFGFNAGENNEGDTQTAFGSGAGADNTGDTQSAFGANAGRDNTANLQTAFGRDAGRNNLGLAQAVFGANAGRDNTGNLQTAFGRDAGRDNTGNFQSAFGINAGRGNTGNTQTAFGRDAGRDNTGASQSVFGSNAGTDNTGNRVIGLGIEATRINTGNDVVALGFRAGMGNTLDNQFIVQQENVNSVPLIQGDFASGNVGIGTIAPQERLDVVGNVNVSGTVYYGALQANSPHAFLHDHVGYTRICKRATDGVIVMQVVELVDGVYVDRYVPNHEDCYKEHVSNVVITEEFVGKEKVITETIEYKNIWSGTTRQESFVSKKDVVNWVAGINYAQGSYVTYKGTVYKVLTSHTSQEGWSPVLATSLFSRAVEEEIVGVNDWVQPTGVHDAYSKGSVVTYEGVRWVSIIDSNVWSPTITGWELEKIYLKQKRILEDLEVNA